MGVIEKTYYKNLPNATKCNTIEEVFKSHAYEYQKVTVELTHIYGILILLGIGVAGALTSFIIEIICSRGGKNLKPEHFIKILVILNLFCRM